MLKLPPLEELLIVSEEMITYCSQMMSEEETNSFATRIELAKEFRIAGLNPVFLVTLDFRDLYVTSEEFLRKKMN